MKRHKTDHSGGEINVEAGDVKVQVLAPEESGYENVSLGQLMREQAKADHSCWGCRCFMKPEDPGVNPALSQLWSLYDQGRGKMGVDALAEQMAKAYRALIFKPRDDRRQAELQERPNEEPVTQAVELWTAEMIRLHLKHHMFLPKVIHQKRVQQSMTMEDTLSRMCFERSPEGVTVPVKEHIKLFFEAQKATSALLATNPDRFVEM